MKISRSKTTATAIALFLVLTIAFTLVALPAANAHTPPWLNIPTRAFINVAPNPVGVGQTVAVVIFLDRTMYGALVTNEQRMHNYNLTITKPDGKTETQIFPYIADPTSAQYWPYTPTQVGTYQFVFSYPGQTFTWSGAYQNDTYAPSTSKTFYLTVQQEQIPAAINSYPLPTEYWTRPIESQNTYWYTLASNWFGTGSAVLSGENRKFQPDGAAPNSAHIMWTKPIGTGGVVGGSNLGVEGNTFYMGLSYNQRFGNPIIMNGKLSYAEPYGNSGSGGDYVCVDLRTGKELWRTNTTGIGAPSFGYYINYDDPNQHGILPGGLLFTSNFARAYNPLNGVVTATNITNVPSGTLAVGPQGEQLRYTISNIGTTANPNWRLTEWNSSLMNDYTPGQIGAGNWYPGFINASLARNYDWNVSIPVLPGLSNPSIISARYGDILFGRSSTFTSTIGSNAWGTPNPYTFWALSLKPGQQGQLMWIKNYSAPAGNLTLYQGLVDMPDHVFTMYCRDTMQWWGYSMDDGHQLWGPTPRPQSDYDYYEASLSSAVAYGHLYYAGYGGVCYCYDMKNGSLLWTYGNGVEPNNNTFSGLQTPWGRYTMMVNGIADGKIYLDYTEHSPNTPLYKGTRLRCVDAYTGKELFTLMSYGSSYGGISAQIAIADGDLVYLNQYDMQIYCLGKGPSATTVEAPLTAITVGGSAVIQGTVTDIAAGTKQNEQAARFPNGVPAVSDASMGAWMEYVYMQKPRPANATGVEVTIDAIDPNGNFVHLGSATSDTSGTFGYAWTTPDVPGKYTVIATFAGSESYWPSYAETYTVISEAPAVTPPPTYPQPIDYTMPIIGAAIAVIIAVAIATILLLRKRP